jgi:branched-chain amino acid transport system substrate-binding protein
LRQRFGRKRPVVVVLIIASALAACSSSSKSTSSGAGSGGALSSAATSITAKGSPIKVGIAAALTGNNASLFAVGPEVAKAWSGCANAHSGIAGRPVQLVVRDTKSDPASAQAAAKQLVESDGVVAMIVLDEVGIVSIAPYLQTKRVALLGVTYTVDVAGKLPNVFSVTTGIQGLAPGAVIAAKADNRHRFGSLVCAEAPACAQADALFKQLSPSVGLTYAGQATVAADAPNYTAECVELTGKGSDFLNLSLATAVAARVANDCIRQGYKGDFGAISATVIIKELAKVAGSGWAGPINAFPWWIDHPEVQQFRDAMKQYAPALDYRNPTSTAVWVSLEVFRKALANTTGDVTSQSVITAYGNLKDETMGGLLPQPVSFTPDQPGPVLTCFWMYHYKAGDGNPMVLPAQGTSGNGQTGALATSCFPPK